MMQGATGTIHSKLARAKLDKDGVWHSTMPELTKILNFCFNPSEYSVGMGEYGVAAIKDAAEYMNGDSYILKATNDHSADVVI